MLSLHITNETNRLKAVVLGLARNIGDQPSIEDTYDPKSLEHLKAGTYPEEQDMVKEIKAVEEVLKKHQVEVYRPKVIENYNQIFSRDIGFVIEDKFISSKRNTATSAWQCKRKCITKNPCRRVAMTSYSYASLRRSQVDSAFL